MIRLTIALDLVLKRWYDTCVDVVEDLISEYKLPLTVKTLRSKGPILQMKIPPGCDFNVKDLPSIFIQVEKNVFDCVDFRYEYRLYDYFKRSYANVSVFRSKNYVRPLQ